MSEKIYAGSERLNQEELVSLVRKWGDVTTDALLEKDCHVFSMEEIEGFIGYKIASKNAVVFGDPVCAAKDKPILAKAFEKECEKKNLGVVYAIVSEDFAKWASDNLAAASIEFGNNFILNPNENPAENTGSKAGLVRKKVKHALGEGVLVKEYLGEDVNIEKQMEEIAEEWVQNRKGPQVYLSQVTLFKDRDGKRWFYAQKGDKIVGFLVINELRSQNRWLLNNVMITNSAPKGVSELLVIGTLEVLAKEASHLVLIGPIPLAKLGEIKGLGAVQSAFIRILYNIPKRLFQLNGHAIFWDKFQPKSESSFLVFPNKNFGFSSIKALMLALNVRKG